jgi:hypothetical protein
MKVEYLLPNQVLPPFWDLGITWQPNFNMNFDGDKPHPNPTRMWAYHPKTSLGPCFVARSLQGCSAMSLQSGH